MSTESSDEYLQQVKDEIRAQADALPQRPLLPRQAPPVRAVDADSIDRDRLAYPIAQLTDPHYRGFVEHAFRAILKRAPGAAEADAQLHALASGAAKAEVLGNLRWSPEGRRIGVHVAGLLPRYVLAKSMRIPLLGPLLQWGIALAGLPLLARNLRAVETLASAARHEAAVDAQALRTRLDELAHTQAQLRDGLGDAHRRIDDAHRRADAASEVMQAIELALRGRIEALEANVDTHGGRLDELEFLRQRIYAINHWSHQLTQAFVQIEDAAGEYRRTLERPGWNAALATVQADSARRPRNEGWLELLVQRVPAAASVLVLASGPDWSELLAARGLRPCGESDAAAACGESVSPRERLRRCEDGGVDAMTVLALPSLARVVPLIELLGEASRIVRPGGCLLVACAREPNALADSLLARAAPAPVDIQLLAQALVASGFDAVTRVDASDATPALLAQRTSA